MRLLLAIIFAGLIAACGGGEAPAPTGNVPLPFRLASPVSGDTETVLHLYQALYGKAPSNPQLTTFKSQIAANGAAVWANSLAASFNDLSNSAFATQVLNNISITESSLAQTTQFGSSKQTYEALQHSFVDYLNAVGIGSRGVVAGQLTKIISTLEVDTQFGVFARAAISLNRQVTVNNIYSADQKNVVDAVVSSAVADAGGNQTVAEGSLVALDGSASAADFGRTLTYVWTLTSRPTGSTAVLNNATSARPTFAADVTGTYVASLVVNDGKVSSGAATVTITAAVLNAIGPGRLVEVTQAELQSTDAIARALQSAGSAAMSFVPRYAVQTYRILYRTVDGQGMEVTASALVAVPQKIAGSVSPVLAYQHGTITRDADAPSRITDANAPPVAFASLGYIVLAADYVGYGSTKGLAHPYLLSAPSAAAVVDLLTAARYWRHTQGLRDNQQLFLAGYSQGGHVSLATQRVLQSSNSPLNNQLVRVVAGSGPYNVLQTLDVLLAQIRQANPIVGALVNPGFLRLLGNNERAKVRDAVLQQIVGEGSDVVFSPDFLDAFLADDRARVERNSNVTDYSPQAVVRLFHGRDDKVVPFAVSVSTVQDMQTRGAGGRVSLAECSAQPSGHIECASEFWQFVMTELATAAQDL